MRTLDIVPLRSFLAVVAFSGVRRAGEALHLSRSAVTGHVRRLEQELGCRLFEPQGRSIGLTSDGQELADHARRILRDHDDAVRALSPPEPDELFVAATEHAAEFVVPTVMSVLGTRFPGRRVRLRLTRSEHVRDLTYDSRADVGLMLTRPARGSTKIATLPLRWFGADEAPATEIILFSPPCAVRQQALTALGGRAYRVARECSDLTTVLTSAREGAGVTPLPLLGASPDGLRHMRSLPALPDIALYVATSGRVDAATKTEIVTALRDRLAPAFGDRM